jgi:glycosyltransferase involved in cell wall biosynthesis
MRQSSSAAGGLDQAVPRVTVLIPAYQVERYIDEALASARAQTVRDLEIIVVDDGSTDETAAIVARHAALDPRVRFICQDHAGISAARNRGLAEARAPWVALLDADDVAVPGRLERQLAFLDANPDVAVLGAYGWHIGRGGRRMGVFEAGPTTRAAAMEMRKHDEVVYLLASSVILDREVIMQLGGFRKTFATAGDVELWTRVLDGHLVLALPEHLVMYRIHPTSISSGRFFEQQQLTMLISRNAGRRRAGLPEIDVAQLQAELRAQPFLHRAWRRRRWQSRYWYRRAGGILADRDPHGVLWLVAAFLIGPDVVIGRLHRQVVPFLLRRSPRRLVS